MIKFSRRLFLSGLTTLAVISAMQITTSCSDKGKISNNLSDKSLGEVNLYSSRHYNTDTELYEGFTKETGIQVNLVEGSADELIERIKSEGEHTKADVFMTVDVGRFWLKKQISSCVKMRQRWPSLCSWRSSLALSLRLRKVNGGKGAPASESAASSSKTVPV